MTPAEAPPYQKAPAVRPQLSWALIVVAAAAFISFFLSFQAGIFVLVFAVIAWWAWQHPEEGFLFLIVLAPLLPMLKITHTIDTFTLVKDVIILTLFTRLFLVPLLRQALPYRRNVLWAPALALSAWTVLEAFKADELLLGLLRARDIILYLLLYFAVLYLPHSQARMKERLRWFVLSLLAVLWLAIYQWFWAADSAVLRFDPAREIWIPRISSIMAHPSILGQYLVMAAALLAATTAYVRRRRAKMVLAGLLAAVLPFIFLTYSRAVWLGLAAALAAMAAVLAARFFLSGRPAGSWWRQAAVGAVLLVLAAVATLRLTPAGTFVRSSFDPTYASNEERLIFMARLIAPMTGGEALVGRGLGDVTRQNFRRINLEAHDIAAGSARAVQAAKNRTLVDNQHLKTFVEMGLAGLIIYGWLYWRVFKAGMRATAGKTAARRTLGLGAVGFLAAFITQGFFIDIWDIFPTNAAFWTVAALLSAKSGALRKHCSKRRVVSGSAAAEHFSTPGVYRRTADKH